MKAPIGWHKIIDTVILIGILAMCFMIYFKLPPALITKADITAAQRDGRKLPLVLSRLPVVSVNDGSVEISSDMLSPVWVESMGPMEVNGSVEVRTDDRDPLAVKISR